MTTAIPFNVFLKKYIKNTNEVFDLLTAVLNECESSVIHHSLLLEVVEDFFLKKEIFFQHNDQSQDHLQTVLEELRDKNTLTLHDLKRLAQELNGSLVVKENFTMDPDAEKVIYPIALPNIKEVHKKLGEALLKASQKDFITVLRSIINDQGGSIPFVEKTGLLPIEIDRVFTSSKEIEFSTIHSILAAVKLNIAFCGEKQIVPKSILQKNTYRTIQSDYLKK